MGGGIDNSYLKQASTILDIDEKEVMNVLHPNYSKTQVVLLYYIYIYIL